jgi:hypothetical protein
VRDDAEVSDAGLLHRSDPTIRVAESAHEQKRRLSLPAHLLSMTL